MLGYGAGAVFSDGNWRGVFESAIPFELIMLFFSFLVIPESPRWLALRKRPLEAVDALIQAQVSYFFIRVILNYIILYYIIECSV